MKNLTDVSKQQKLYEKNPNCWAGIQGAFSRTTFPAFWHKSKQR